MLVRSYVGHTTVAVALLRNILCNDRGGVKEFGHIQSNLTSRLSGLFFSDHENRIVVKECEPVAVNSSTFYFCKDFALSRSLTSSAALRMQHRIGKHLKKPCKQ